MKAKMKMHLRDKVMVRILETPALQKTKQRIEREKKDPSKLVLPANVKRSVDDTFAAKVLEDVNGKDIHPFVVEVVVAHKDSCLVPGDKALMSIRKAGRVLDDLDSDFPTTADVVLVDGERLFIFPEEFIVGVDNSLEVENGVVIKK
jgi:predicted nucleic acid-binding protein